MATTLQHAVRVAVVIAKQPDATMFSLLESGASPGIDPGTMLLPKILPTAEFYLTGHADDPRMGA